MSNGNVIDFSRPEFQATGEDGAAGAIDFSQPEFQQGAAPRASGAEFGAGPVESFVAPQPGQEAEFAPIPEPVTGPREEAGSRENLIRSFIGQGFLLGFGDEAEALIRSAFGDRSYDEVLADLRAQQRRFAAENPALSTGFEIGGSMFLPVGTLARGGRFIDRARRSAGVGAVTGGITGAGTGEGAQERAVGAGIGTVAGGAVGAAVPAVTEGVIGAGRAAVRGLQRAGAPIRATLNPEAEAARRVARAREQDIGLGEEGLGTRRFEAAQQEGLPVANIDVGGRVTRRLARAAANQSPEAGAMLERLVQDRFQGQGARTEEFINNLFTGGRIDSFTQRQALEAAARRANDPAYRLAYAAGDRSLRSPEIDRLLGAPAIEQALAGAATRGRNRVIAEGGGAFNPRIRVTDDGRVMLQRTSDGVPIFPNLRLWDLAKRELDDAARAAARTGRNEEAGALQILARDLRTELDRLVPEYKTARGTALEFFGADNALQAGSNFARQTRFSIPEARAQLAKMSEPERELFAQGFADEIVNVVNRTRDRSNVVSRISETADARRRIELALGRERGRQLLARLHVENVMDFARGAVTGNSTSARQLVELGLLGGGFGAAPFDPQSGAGLIAMGLLLRGGRAIRAGREARVMEDVARLLASDDPNAINRAIQQISRSDALLERFRNFDAALARAAGQQTGQEVTE